MIAAIYARKSNDEGDKDADAKSVTRQVERAQQYAARHRMTVSDEYIYLDDGISGAEFKKRPGLQRPLATLEGKPPFQVLLVSEQSRLGRDTIRTLALIQSIQDAGVRIYSYLDDREISVDDEMGEVEGFMRSWASSQERKKASQRTRDAMRRMAERGQLTGGWLYGYRTENGVRVIEPKEAEVVRRIYKRRAEGAGLFRIARELERDRVPSRLKARWWNSTIGGILHNPMYHGEVIYGRVRETKRGGTRVTVKSPDPVITIRNEKLRIIPEPLWREVQALNKKAREATWRNASGKLLSRPTASKHLLAPFLACGQCGASMHARREQGCNPEKWIYRCTGYHNGGKERCSNNKGMPVEWADKRVTDAFEEALASQLVMGKLEEFLDEQRRRAVDPAPLRAEAAKLEKEIKRLVEALADGGDIREVRQAIADRKGRLEHVEGQLHGIGQVRTFDKKTFLRQLEPVMADWRAHLKKNVSTAQQVLRKVLPNKIKAMPDPAGGWSLNGLTDYTAVLKQLGFDSVLNALKAQGWIDPAASWPPPMQSKVSMAGSHRR